MGLPERLKSRLAPGGKTTPARQGGQGERSLPDRTPEKHTARSGGPIARRPDTPGLPVFQQPPLPKDHRAILVACAKTGKASWAIVKEKTPDTEGQASGQEWVFQRNITAVPATAGNAPKGGSKGSKRKDDDRALDARDIDLTGFSCGVCGTGKTEPGGGRILRCGHCHTLQCAPYTTYKCPGCAAQIDTSKTTAMDSMEASHGAQDKHADNNGALSGTPIGKATGKRRQVGNSDNAGGGSRRALGGYPNPRTALSGDRRRAG